MPGSQSAKFTIFIALAIISAVTFLAFFPSLGGGFYHDDIPNLVYNDNVKIDDLTYNNLHQAATSSTSGKLKRPISMASFAINYYYFGEYPYSFKLTNLILHILTGLIIFIFTLNLQKIKSRTITLTENKTAIYFALTVTLIWLIHPLHVSTVAYIVQRMAILSTLFILLTLLFYTQARYAHITNRKGTLAYSFSSAIFFLLAIFSKENGFLAPIYIISIELIIFRAQWLKLFSKKYVKKIIITVLALLAATLLYILPLMLEYLNNWYANSREFSLEERLLSQLRIVVKYIYWFFVPNIQNFGLYHDDFQISKSFLNPPTIILCLIFLLSMTALAFAVAKKRPLLSFGITWFFIGHLIESTVIPLEMIYEHRNYLSFIGLSIAATDIAVMLIEKFQKISKIVFITGMLICCIFAGLTYARSGHWSTPFSFAYFEALHHPNSNRANHALGMIYRSLVLNGETKFKSDAYRYLKKASKIDSAFIQSEVALLQFSFEQKDPASPEWIDSIASKLNTKIIRSDYVNLLDQMLQCKNELCFLPKDARGTLIDAAYTNPRLHIRPILHAKVLSIRANYLLNSGGNIQEAENNLQSAIMLNPNDIQNYADYINLLLLKDQPKLALKIIDDAYNADKNNAHKTELDMLKNNIIQNIN